ncbi:MAG: TetR family transcriptional regulator [Actinomycetota bacterium]
MTSRSGRTPGPKPRISRRQIADAAIEVGFDKLSIGAVAARLGVAPSALYTHVDDKADLIIAAADLVSERTASTELANDWRRFLTEEARRTWSTIRAHPGIYRAVDETNRVPTAYQQRFAQAHAHLVGLGFTTDNALLALDIVYDLAADSANRSSRIHDQSDDDLHQLATDWSAPLDAPLAEAMSAMVVGDPEPLFRRRLEVVLTGIEHTLAPTST